MTLAPAAPIWLIGAGKMGSAMASGWLEEGLDPGLLEVQDPHASDDARALFEKFGVHITARIEGDRGAPSMAVIAVKPQMMDEVLPGLAPMMGADTVLLSIAAGRPIASMAKFFAANAAIVRSMPNTPASIGRGMTVAVAGSHVSEAQRAFCAQVLGAVGDVAWIDDEGQLDAVTAVSGSGPAYVFHLAECLAKAGVEAGLDKALAERLARATVSGAGEMLHLSDLGADRLRENVTSPGGTTAAALEVLMGDPGLADLLVKAVAAAAARSKQLSE